MFSFPEYTTIGIFGIEALYIAGCWMEKTIKDQREYDKSWHDKMEERTVFLRWENYWSVLRNSRARSWIFATEIAGFILVDYMALLYILRVARDPYYVAFALYAFTIVATAISSSIRGIWPDSKVLYTDYIGQSNHWLLSTTIHTTMESTMAAMVWHNDWTLFAILPPTYWICTLFLVHISSSSVNPAFASRGNVCAMLGSINHWLVMVALVLAIIKGHEAERATWAMLVIFVHGVYDILIYPFYFFGWNFDRGFDERFNLSVNSLVFTWMAYALYNAKDFTECPGVGDSDIEVKVLFWYGLTGAALWLFTIPWFGLQVSATKEEVAVKTLAITRSHSTGGGERTPVRRTTEINV